MRHSPNPVSLRIDDLLTFDPLTLKQEQAYTGWKSGNNLLLNGSAGTGKTFIALYLALEQVMDKGTPYEKVMIIRSVVPTRDIGFLPGSYEEKLEPYCGPYMTICSQLFGGFKPAFQTLEKQKQVEFLSTSFLRGETFENSIIIVDEMQNMNFHELDSIITRIGHDCRIIFCGDRTQSDFKQVKEMNSHLNFIDIIEVLNKFTMVEFGWEDIVRSDFVRDYIMTKEMQMKGTDNGKQLRKVS
jgi:predicted ribonuclease YlaK